MSTKRVLKKISKITLYTLASVLLLIIILLTVAKLSEQKIASMVMENLSTEMKAPFSIKEVNILPLRNFPLLTVELQEFGIGSRLENDSTASDTLIMLKRVYVALKSRPLFQSEIDIEKVEIEGLSLNYRVDSSGATNLDFLMASDTAAKPPADTAQSGEMMNILLQNLTLRNIAVRYADQSMGIDASLSIPEMKLSGSILGESIRGKIAGSLLLSDVTYAATGMDNLPPTSISFDIAYADQNVTINRLALQTEGLSTETSGTVVLSDSIGMNLMVNLTRVDLGELLRYIPSKMLAQYGLIDLKGILSTSTRISGYYYDSLLLPSVYTDISFSNGYVKTADYPELQKITVKGRLTIPNPDNLKTMKANFSTIALKTPQSKVKVGIRVANFEKPIYRIKGEMLLTLNEFAPLLPDSTLESLSGSIIANFSTKGQLPDSLGMASADYFLRNSSLDIRFKEINAQMDSSLAVNNFSGRFRLTPGKKIYLDGLTLSVPAYQLNLENASLRTQLSGDIGKPEQLAVLTDSLLIRFNRNVISGRFTVANLLHPQYTATTNLSLNFDELKAFIPDTLIENITGSLTARFESSGTLNLDSIADQAMDILFKQSKLSVDLDRFGVSLPNDTLTRIDRLSFRFAMANDTLYLNKFRGEAHGIALRIDSTRVWNVYSAMLKGEPGKRLIADTRIWVNHFDYAMLTPFMQSDSTQTEPDPALSDTGSAETDSSFNIPPYIIRGLFAMDSIRYGDMTIKNFSTKFRVDDSLYVIDALTLDAFGGNMQLSALYDTRNDSLTTIEFKGVTDKIDIHRLLKENDNFDQTYITHKNLEGLLTGTLYGRIIMKDTVLLYEKMNMLGNFKLENGGIYNFEPAMELSKFTNLKELDNIVFRTLESNVFIYKNKIYFPRTDIISTAMDISVYGMQSFSDDYEYHMIVHLSDVLIGKSKKLLKRQGMESDLFEGKNKAKRSGLYLVALEKGKESKYGFDNKKLQRRMKTTIRVQERGLNLIFHPKVVNFSTEIDRHERKMKKKHGKKS